MRFILLAAIVLFISGCASSADPGKFAYKTPATTVKPEYGYLKVYTHSYPGKTFIADLDDQEFLVYTPYKIYRKGGEPVKAVESSDFKPATVKLAKGEYVVVAEMREGEVSSYSVTIEAGQVLEIDSAMLLGVLSKTE